ncbi:AcrB/AcrD/AcrF family protein [Sphingomonas montanisoli]|uniref:AcrB/AcrD/AcrF family protein n=1 Tax=Sphingomonas montanisoli TaxID=2606412 RepID=UPI001FE7568A|nr:AcrB/AcrD/AcrF family protein [Sphingomonas montanisoli]
MEDRIIAFVERHWRRTFWLMFAGTIIYMLIYKWASIRVLGLGDTDDNMRLAQVQAWLNGQGWFDLRQHKLDPPAGASIHWTRIVDLPIAVLLFLSRQVTDNFTSLRFATTVAPMLAFGATLWALILASRRLIAPLAYPLAFAMLLCAQTAMFMWFPLRVDHHGWQLAMLMLALAGLADPVGKRGGVTVATATVVSLGIGLELLPSMAMAGAATVLRWIWDRAEADRMRGYAVVLAGGSAIIFAGFASYDNRLPVCDAFSPVYLTAMLLAGALLFALSYARVESRVLRLALAGVAAGAVAGVYAGAFPQCLGRPEHLSPELEKLWFSHVREVRPLHTKAWRDAVNIAALPVFGALGAIFAWWRARGQASAPAWATIALLSVFSTACMFWQSRYGPQAQMLGVFGATALAWPVMSRLLNAKTSVVRVLGPTAAFLAVSGLGVEYVTTHWPKSEKAAKKKVVDRSVRCPRIAYLRELGAFKPTVILTHVDFGPRLIAMTGHSAIAGPYHRNSQAILDVHHAFRDASPKVAHDVMKRHKATMLLVCPGMAETTLYDKGGFYRQLMKDQVPTWLERVELPANSPYRLWKLVG